VVVLPARGGRTPPKFNPKEYPGAIRHPIDQKSARGMTILYIFD